MAVLSRVRTVLFWAHLICGVSAAVVILIMSVTGVALTYERQMEYWADTRHYRADPPPGAEPLPVRTLLEAVALEAPGATVSAVSLRADPTAPAALSLAGRTLYVDPYTARVHGEGTGEAWRAFFTSMTNWHRWLAMSGESRATGRAVTGAANLAFLFIVLSGLYLWWPRTLTWTHVRQVIWFRSAATSKARDFNWHNVLGFWSALPLALVVYSGVVISYPWAGNLVYQAVGETPPVRGARGAGAARPAEPDSTRLPDAPASTVDLDATLARAVARVPGWQVMTLQVPAPGETDVVVGIEEGFGGQPQLRRTLTFDAATLALRDETGFDSQSVGQRLRSFLRFAHTGEFFGLAGQTVAGLVSAVGAVLVYTGLALSWRRFRAWRRRRYTDFSSPSSV